MSVVMLYFYQGYIMFSRISFCKTGRKIQRVHIAHYKLGFYPEQILHVPETFLVQRLIFDGVHIAEILADICEAVFCQGK